MLFIWFTHSIALSPLFSLFASPQFLIFYQLRLHAQPLLFSLSTEINFLTLSCPSLVSRVCLWQLGWVPIGFMVVQSVLRWFGRIYGGLICALVGLCGSDWFCFAFPIPDDGGDVVVILVVGGCGFGWWSQWQYLLRMWWWWLNGFSV